MVGWDGMDRIMEGWTTCSGRCVWWTTYHILGEVTGMNDKDLLLWF